MVRNRHENDPREAETRAAEDVADSGRIAGRLDRLSSDQAESVIRRAIHLQSEAAHDDSFDVEMLQQIATELGIPLSILEQALAEQRRDIAAGQKPSPGFLDRLLGISGFDESVVLRGSEAEIERVLETWMRSHEAMKRTRRTPDGAEWGKNSQILAELKIDLGLTNSTTTLRNSGTARHHFRRLADDEVLFTIEADREHVRKIGLAVLIPAIALPLIGAAFAFASGSLSGGFISAIAGPLLFGGIAVASMRTWSGNVRKALARVVDAVTDPDTAGVYETIGAKIGSLFDRIRASSSSR